VIHVLGMCTRDICAWNVYSLYMCLECPQAPPMLCQVCSIGLGASMCIYIQTGVLDRVGGEHARLCYVGRMLDRLAGEHVCLHFKGRCA